MWYFKQSGAFDSNRRSKLEEFFSSQNAATSVVRESIQNSLDALNEEQSKKVRVRFTISERNWNDIASFAHTTDSPLTLDDHTNSDGLERYAKTFLGKKFRCLAVEDYGTKGLTGTTDKDEALSGSNFVGFWWNEGITGKGNGTLGNHGVGKITLTRVSEMSTFWALTKRADDEKTFLVGFSNLPFHRLSNRSYLGYGRYGVATKKDGKEIFLPVADPAEISKFSNAFGLDRQDYGLSVFIPAVVSGINHDALLQAVIEDYYWSILNGQLEVTICDVSKGAETVVDASNLGAAMDQLPDAAKPNEIRQLVNAAIKVHGMKSGNPNYFSGIQPEISTEAKNRRARLTAKQFTTENLARLKEQFEKGHMVAAQFSVDLEPKVGEPSIGTFEVFLKGTSDSNFDRISQYIRRGLVITEQKPNIPGRFGYCFVIVDDKDMSDYLGTAEGPAHTNWVLGKFNEHARYKSDWPLRFIMDAANQLYRIAAGEDEEKNEIQNFADDIFSIDLPGSGQGPVPQQQLKKRKRSQPPVPPPQVPKPAELIRLEKMEDGTGYAIYPAKDLSDLLVSEGVSLPLRVDIKSAYLSVKGNNRSFKDYSPLDFNYSSTIKLETSPNEAVKVLKQDGNQLSLEIFDPAFQIHVKGFDKHRDLLNRTNLKVTESEVIS